MTKYILNLFPFDCDAYQLRIINDLAVFIGIYNYQQPDLDFINYLNNSVPYSFLFYAVGASTTKDGYPRTYDVHFRDESKRVGTIEVVDVK